MSIDHLYKINGMKDTDLPTLQKSLEHLHENAVGMSFHQGTAAPTVESIPMGKICVWDDGAGNKKLYFRTGKDNVGSIPLT
jgi:hypothetical protein